MTRRSAELSALLARLPASTQVSGGAECLVTGIAVDSREVKPGEAFVAVRGEHADGHRFTHQAVANGAIALVLEDVAALQVPAYVSVIRVPDSRRALSALAAAFHGDPSEALAVVGVTGTSGKTTTVAMLRAILERAGMPCGVIGTIGAAFGQRTWELRNTTPPPHELHALLAQMRDAGAKAVAMEVSSHALALERVENVSFRVAVLTNVTRDHLDFHHTLEAYAAAKHHLFTFAHACVLNAGDAFGVRWRPEIAARVPTLTYALAGEADLVPSDVTGDASGSRFRLGGTAFEIHPAGRFNVENALAAIGAARLLGIQDRVAAEGLSTLAEVPGRMQRLSSGGIDVVIDYAHKPDALENALLAVRETTRGALRVVFGCGGDRDRGKRPLMGAIAGRLADRVYVTSDNPRSEPPQAIADEILTGIASGQACVELDRRAAIVRAIEDSNAGDVVLIAGKGHETYQLVGDRVLPFDDAAVARDVLARREVVR